MRSTVHRTIDWARCRVSAKEMRNLVWRPSTNRAWRERERERERRPKGVCILIFLCLPIFRIRLNPGADPGRDIGSVSGTPSMCSSFPLSNWCRHHFQLHELVHPKSWVPPNWAQWTASLLGSLEAWWDLVTPPWSSWFQMVKLQRSGSLHSFAYQRDDKLQISRTPCNCIIILPLTESRLSSSSSSCSQIPLLFDSRAGLCSGSGFCRIRCTSFYEWDQPLHKIILLGALSSDQESWIWWLIPKSLSACSALVLINISKTIE